MHKFWKIKESKSNKLIFIKDNCIYKGNPKEEELNRLNTESINLTFLDNLFSIPYSYIRKIENQKGKNEIKIFYGKDSEDELIIENENIKKEIFDFIKEDNSNFNYSSELPSVLKYGKAQFFALLFTTGIYLWVMNYAIELESGTQYELRGGRPGLGAIVFAVANLGTLKVTIGFVILLGVIIFTLTKKLKSRSEIETLSR
ncbi:conserved hypothetical protein [Tenacibaculum sp. 190524A02b]|uniref:DUF2812 domain-containing protein n=1 Tax=Tenacibaculum vairaonense TaxID=3137860 RepID=A0ABP1FDW2_9FLAO